MDDTDRMLLIEGMANRVDRMPVEEQHTYGEMLINRTIQALAGHGLCQKSDMAELAYLYGDLKVTSDMLAGTVIDLLAMHNRMMSEIDHKNSFYSAETIQMMNEAPNRARRALHLALEQLPEAAQ